MKYYFLLVLLYLSQSFALFNNDLVLGRKVKYYSKRIGLKFNNARRDATVTPLRTKAAHVGNYTVFPPVFRNVPESPLFTIEPTEGKKNVQSSFVRSKRAAAKSKNSNTRSNKGKKKQAKQPKQLKGKPASVPLRLRKLPSKVAKSGQKKQDNRRLIAGRDARIEDYPYVVSIQKNRQHWCSGALLNPTLVITTANCMWKSDSQSHLKIRAGSRHTDRGGETAYIQEVVKHPLWSLRRNPNYDLALLLLDRSFRFSDKLHAVDLPNVKMIPPFEDAWVTSWGAERRDGVFPGRDMTLQVAYMRVMDFDKCNNITSRFGVTVTRQFICLAQTGKQGPCTRDTGAPAVSDGVIWGVASWGLRKLCGTERFPAMFSYIAADENMDFINNATRFLMSENRDDPFIDRFPMGLSQPKKIFDRNK